MDLKIIDSHIHLDWYEPDKQEIIIGEMASFGVEALITVSANLSSANKNLKISAHHPSIHPAVGYHPEQNLPRESEVSKLFYLIEENRDDIIAIGEVGLPYYLRREDSTIKLAPYQQLLEMFIKKANLIEMPLILHAIYEDADLVCDLLEKHSVEKAHFHWFKGEQKVTERLKANGYFISVTPDILYEPEIRDLVSRYPLSLMMVETDGPWVFKGPFENKLTHPKMIHDIIEQIAAIKQRDLKETYEVLLENTKNFYRI
ncbi:MAG TPA: TatD family hydrolase [Virgibacillus sp.]|nr:TatD family hydrolase [Virgibacillus sp.]